tara:strand:+ start:351 stop:623 length:273 start_codon:yes stop_codon:yes gene_type:complete
MKVHKILDILKQIMDDDDISLPETKTRLKYIVDTFYDMKYKENDKVKVSINKSVFDGIILNIHPAEGTYYIQLNEHSMARDYHYTQVFDP